MVSALSQLCYAVLSSESQREYFYTTDLFIGLHLVSFGFRVGVLKKIAESFVMNRIKRKSLFIALFIYLSNDTTNMHENRLNRRDRIIFLANMKIDVSLWSSLIWHVTVVVFHCVY